MGGLLAFVFLDPSQLCSGQGGTQGWGRWVGVAVVTPSGVWQVRWERVGLGNGCGDEDLAIVWSWWSGGLVYISGALKNVVGPWAVSSLLEPSGDRPIVFEGVVEACPDLHLYQSVVDPLLGVVPLSPVSAQLPVSFF